MRTSGIVRSTRSWAANFQEYRDDRICKLRVVFDMLDVSRQLGLMPASGSLGERSLAAAQRGAMRVRRGLRRASAQTNQLTVQAINHG